MIGARVPREHYIDWLRNFGILLLFPFHTARIFDYWEPNYVKSATLSWGASWFIVAVGYWFMPLLFWLAGAASWHALKRRTPVAYQKERLARLGIPLVFGLLVVVPPQAYLAKLSQPGFSQSYWQFLGGYFRDWSDISGYFGSFTPGHLWFILFLLVFSLAGLPVLLALKRGGGGPVAAAGGTAGTAQASGVTAFFARPWTYLSFFIVLALSEALPAPGGKNPVYYFFLFLAGYATVSDERIVALIDRIKGWCLLSLVVLLPLQFTVTARALSVQAWSPTSILLTVTGSLVLWLTLTAIIGYGRRYLNSGHDWLPYLNRGAYPVYVIHQTALLIIGYYVVPTGLGVWTQFAVIALLSLAACLALYELVIRRTRLTRWLLGVKEEGVGFCGRRSSRCPRHY